MSITATDLIDQKRIMNAPGRKTARAAYRAAERPNLENALKFMVERFPPVLVAAQGMIFGLWFFRRGLKRYGMIAGTAMFFAVLLAASQAFFHRDIFMAEFLLVIILLAAGFEAVRHHLHAEGYSHEWSVWFMSALTPFTTLFTAYLLFHLAVLITNPPIGRVDDMLYLGGDRISRGAMVYLSATSDIKAGDIVSERGDLLRVMAMPGQEIEVADCNIYVDGYEAPPSLWPLDEGWERRRCRVEVESREAPPGYALTIIRLTNGRWIHRQISLGREKPKLRLIYWPLHEWRWFP